MPLLRGSRLIRSRTTRSARAEIKMTDIKGMNRDRTRRIVVKVGSNVLSREDGSIDITRVSSLVDQIAWLKREGYEVILVTSGAVACGKSILGPEDALDSVEQRQVYSAVGQVRLMDLYHSFFKNYGMNVGQVLTMKENFAPGKAYSNQKGCMEAMLRSGVIPIVNENDTVCVTELMFTDNDELSGLIARMMSAEKLILLSNIDGLYNAAPGSEGASVIKRIETGEEISSYIAPSKSSHGRGGMLSKSTTAMEVAAAGITVIIANGKRENILSNLITDAANTIHTEFSAEETK